MEDFLIYLLKSSGVVFLFAVCYQLFLRKETFFNTNRWFLLLGLFAAIIIPFVSITKTILVENTTHIIHSVTPATELVVLEKTINWWMLLTIIYVLGVVLLVLKFIAQLFSLRKLISAGKTSRAQNYCIVEVHKDISPFSFLNYIVVNPKKYNVLELETILNHEKFHVKQWHSLDVVLGHLMLIFLWFNPFVWWYKKLIQQNLEFITDKETTAVGVDKKEYQYLLLKENINQGDFLFANTFFNSLIKKRIIMLNKEQSKKQNVVKYSFIIPLLLGFVFLFNVETIAQSSANNTIKVVGYADSKSNPIYIIDGILRDKEYLEQLDKDDNIRSINVIKGKKAIEKYGEKGKNGVIEVTTKNKNQWKVGVGVTPSDEKGSSAESHKSSNIIYDIKKALIIIDKKESTIEEMRKLDKDNAIESVNVLKGEKATVKYGDKAKHGVIEITTK